MPKNVDATRISGATRGLWRRVVAIFATLGLIVVLLCGTGVIYLARPGTPSTSGSMRFEGLIELPRHDILSILDYLSLEQDHLYVTNITNGTLFDVKLSGSNRNKRRFESGRQDRLLQERILDAGKGTILWV